MRSRGFLVAACACLCLLILPFPALAQSASGTPGAGTSPQGQGGLVQWPASGPDAPLPYGEDEFPEWAEDLRRFEVITLGSWPLTFLFSGMVYDVGRWTAFLGTDPDSARLYAPLFLAPSNKPEFTSKEVLEVLAISAVLSMGIGLADLFINQDIRNRERARQEESRRSLRESSSMEVLEPSGKDPASSQWDASQPDASDEPASPRDGEVLP